MISTPERLVDEFRRLGQTRPDSNAQPVAVFSAAPWQAYTLIAALQACSRNPNLSDSQREIVVGFARQIGEQLINAARAVLGADSAIELTTNMGFHQEFDVPRETDAEAAPDEPGDDADEDQELDSHMIGERRCRYVEPTFTIQRAAESEMELSKCAKCARFFVQDMPIRFFMGEGEDTLGLEVCETCAPTVLKRVQAG